MKKSLRLTPSTFETGRSGAGLGNGWVPSLSLGRNFYILKILFAILMLALS